ncbi:hypothetical protein O181_069039 [Austropuccinia psidii MF-1]|uniref:Uncharacterized protein n=1 Tax=Austropuccinia psidii MF-1 TaxID=1389203 RepID=A0A9Q3EYH4_9BASI|nr:hypothetical protein [Austropuccinia psidii MF-1]
MAPASRPWKICCHQVGSDLGKNPDLRVKDMLRSVQQVWAFAIDDSSGQSPFAIDDSSGQPDFILAHFRVKQSLTSLINNVKEDVDRMEVSNYTPKPNVRVKAKEACIPKTLASQKKNSTCQILTSTIYQSFTAQEPQNQPNFIITKNAE